MPTQHAATNIRRVMRDRAETVIVGAGIVGTSAPYHLAEPGVTDVLVTKEIPKG